MWFLFWAQNSHYILEVFTAFIAFTSAWIFIDSWVVKKELKTLLRSIGFFVLALASFADAAPIGSAGLGAMTLGTQLGGAGLILLSLLLDPVPVRPETQSKVPLPSSASMITIGMGGSLGILLERLGMTKDLISGTGAQALALVSNTGLWLTLILGFITFLLWFHYHVGIQREWKFLFLGFLLLTLSASATILYAWQDSENVLVSSLLQPSRAVWITEHVLKLAGAMLVAIWTWGFIRFRIFPQLFISFVALSFLIFVTTTVVYTGLILRGVQQDAIQSLATNVKTLDFAMRELKDNAILAAKIAAANDNTKSAIRIGSQDALFSILNTLMFENGTDFMAAVNRGGEVLMRAEDRTHLGDSLAEDPVVWRAFDGKSVVTSFIEPGLTVPRFTIRAASPIIDTDSEGEPEITGAVITGFIIDDAFVEGVKKITDLDVTIYAGAIRSASTFRLPGTQARLVGTREDDQRILDVVLKQARAYTGPVEVLNEPYFAAYTPIKDVEDTPVGMFFTGRSQAVVLEAASNTLRLTFGVSILLMLGIILPIYWLARFITHHQEV